MNTIIIKRFQGIVVCNLLILGMTACSSEPAPWTRPDESPWSETSAASERTAEEPVMVEEPMVIDEPMEESMPERFAEPIMIEEPVPVVATVAVSEPEPEALSPEERIMAMDTGYAVQIFASSAMSGIDQFKSDYGLDDMLAVRTDRDGSVMYVLVSPQPDRNSATVVAADLQQKTGTKPWVRAIQGLQKVVAQ